MAKKQATKKKKPKVYEFTITLTDTNPVVWRKFLAHDLIELPELHMLIQLSMGWESVHLFAFEINGKDYSDTESSYQIHNTFDVEGIELKHVLGKSKKFNYIYDFGDDWIHEIKITNVLEHDSRVKYPVCIGGENACPPEDCGGTPGFARLKDILAGSDCIEKDELLTWLGGYYNPFSFDPNFVNKVFLWGDDEFI